jgi:hypothetical protein
LASLEKYVGVVWRMPYGLVLSTTKGVLRMAMLFFLTQTLAMGITSPSMVTMLASSST